MFCFLQEDLEKSLTRASRQQNRLNPALKPGVIQVFCHFLFLVKSIIFEPHIEMHAFLYIFQKVAVFEEIVKGMKVKTVKEYIHQTRLMFFKNKLVLLNVVLDLILQESATSNWDDIVFIPPGFEVSTEEETKE